MHITSRKKSEAGWHYHTPDFLCKFGGYPIRKMVKEKEDLIEGQLFFISFKQREWIPENIKGYEKGHLQLFGFKFTNVLEVSDWLEYHALFDYNSKVGYTLSEKGKSVIDSGGYDLVHFVGIELDEAFIVYPHEQVTDILTVSLNKLAK